MKKLVLMTWVFMLMLYFSNAQSLTAEDQLALKIPQAETYSSKGISSYVKSNFTSDSARARALFVWVANNIGYDVEMLKLQKNNLLQINTEAVLKTRKTICQGYSELLVELYTECNIPALLVSGYTRQQDGTIARLSHAWVAAMVNGKWWLFDPTWASGSLRNGQFVKMFSNRFYKLTPEEMINDHMPFDPLQQFLHYPITADDFYEGKTRVNTSRKYFGFEDSLIIQASLSSIDQRRNTMRRTHSNGVRNDLIRLYLDNMSRGLQSFDAKTGLDSASNQYRCAIAIFNRYIQYKNNRFASIKPNEIQQLLDSVFQHITNARAVIEVIVAKDDQHKKYLYDLKNSLYQFSLRAEEENAFVKKYLGKG
jgi:hypothetical protein